jgi:leucyl-tRNA synthetase
MKETYDSNATELKWQRVWAEAKAFETTEDPGRPKYYLLEMYPYPSGRIHMGHVRNYSIGDVIARFKAMNGLNVLHPIGWDALGMPAENAAIKHGIHPQAWTLDNIAYMKKQLQRMGFSYDWSREVNSCLPEYYKWNQWIFLKMLEKGLAFRKESWVNWCPKCATVLANEQVVGGACWRCESEVSQKRMEQWFLRTTAYAEELLSGHAELVGWPDHVLQMQKNWIGRSLGAHVNFAVPALRKSIEVFTTRIDTIFGATFLVLSPEHPLVRELIRGPREKELQARVEQAVNETRLKRDLGEAEKEGLDTGVTAVNPYTGAAVPIWVSSYVLMDYGTGAIMAVPAHDSRDFAFARRYGLPIKTVIAPADKADASVAAETDEAFEDEGILIASGPFSGLRSGEAMEKMARFAEDKGFGRQRDLPAPGLGISRQRYWGTPIPRCLLPDLRDCRRPAEGPARSHPARRPDHGRRGVAPGARPEFRAHDLPHLRRPGPARDRHDGHVRRFLVVFFPLLLAVRDAPPVRAGGRQALDARRSLHRRRRARHPAPYLRALLYQGPARPRPDLGRRAVPSLSGPGHGHQRRVGHVQITRQHRRPGRHHQQPRRRRPPPVHPLRVAAGQGVCLVHGRPGRLRAFPQPSLGLLPGES